MYFGSLSVSTLHEFICNVLDHPLNAALEGHCTRIEIVIRDGNVVTIRDNGQGLPINPGSGSEQRVHPLSPTDNRVDRPHYRIQASRHAMGLPVINAVCSSFSVEIKRDGFVWEQRFKDGLPRSSLEQTRSLSDGEATGTSVTFVPDTTIFQAGEFDATPLLRRLRELTYLVPDLTIVVEDLRSGRNHAPIAFSSQSGVIDFVQHLNRDYPVLHDVITIRERVDLELNYKPLGYSGTFDIALQFADVHQGVIVSFMNGVEVEYGGPHIDGLHSALKSTLIRRAAKVEAKPDDWHYGFTDEDSICGLSAVLNMQHPKPESCNSRYYILANSELEDALSTLVEQAIEAFAVAHPDQIQRLVEKCLANKALRLQRRYGT